MKNKLLIVILIILGLYATKALFHPGFYTSHDGGHQIIRLLHFDQGLKDGQFPVRWAGGAMCGYGYPLYIFTYRLPFWLAEFWYFLSDNLVDSIKFTFIISFILSGLTMYWFASKLWKSKPAGFFTAFLYLWAPYRFVDIFVRAALGEAFAFIFIPLIFLGIYGLAKEKDYLFYFFLLTFSLAGLVLSHTMILVVFIIPIALWFLLFLFKSWNNIKYLITVFFAAIFSLFLSAYYWLPATIERSYIKFAKNFSGYYVNHFATLKQLLYSRWGFGFDMAGVIQDEMSFQVGLAQWCVVGLSLMLIISLIIAHKRNKNNYLSIFLGLIITFVISIVLMIPAADRFYKTINNFFVIDIPWKFLSVSLFAAAVLFGGIIVIINNRYLKWGIIAVVVFLAIYGNRNHLKVNQYVYSKDIQYWTSDETSNEYSDYTPVWFLIKCNREDPQLKIISGTAENTLLARKSNRFDFASSVSSPQAKIAAKITYYPGWQLYIDGFRNEVNQEGGQIIINLDKGSHVVSLQFRETPLRNLADMISLASLILIGGLMIKYLVFKIYGV